MIHIINPFIGDDQHNKIQELTIESIKRAQEYEGNNDVEILAAYYKEDEEVVPGFVSRKVELKKSIRDVIPNSAKKLPLISEFFDSIKGDESIDYVIYSNIDIALHYQFYSAVKAFINKGFDAFAINRRRVSEHYCNITDLNQLYSEVGYQHLGYDCFVFKRGIIEKFALGKACIGIPFIDSVMLFNLIAFSSHFKLFTDKHLTFHIGYELVKNWGDKELVAHNKKQYLNALSQIKDKVKLKNVPGAGLPFFKRHFKWLMNPTIHYPTVASLDFKGKGTRYKQTEKAPKGYYEWLQKKIKLD